AAPSVVRAAAREVDAGFGHARGVSRSATAATAAAARVDHRRTAVIPAALSAVSATAGEARDGFAAVELRRAVGRPAIDRRGLTARTSGIALRCARVRSAALTAVAAALTTVAAEHLVAAAVVEVGAERMTRGLLVIRARERVLTSARVRSRRARIVAA